MKHPRLRDSKKLTTDEPYPINELPEELIVRIGGYLAHLLYVGHKDIAGADWGDAFADAVGGKHLDSPVGISDVVLGKMAWSVKTVKNPNPFSARNVRLISGRCSSDYSYGKESSTGGIYFTWQPHGSQFTIHARVPKNAVKFTIKQPPLLTKEDILKAIQFDASWVEIIR